MRSITLFLTVIALLAVLVACGSKEPAPQVQVEQTIQPGDVGALTPGTDAVLGEKPNPEIIEIGGFKCDKATRTLTFRFKNNETYPWQLNNKQSAYPALGEPRGIAVSVNGYATYDRQLKDKDGNLINGPKWPLSENCGGKEILQPGEDVTCTLSPIVIKEVSQLQQGFNEVYIRTPAAGQIIRFTC